MIARRPLCGRRIATTSSCSDPDRPSNASPGSVAGRPLTRKFYERLGRTVSYRTGSPCTAACPFAGETDDFSNPHSAQTVGSLILGITPPKSNQLGIDGEQSIHGADRTDLGGVQDEVGAPSRERVAVLQLRKQGALAVWRASLGTKD